MRNYGAYIKHGACMIYVLYIDIVRSNVRARELHTLVTPREGRGRHHSPIVLGVGDVSRKLNGRGGVHSAIMLIPGRARGMIQGPTGVLQHPRRGHRFETRSPVKNRRGEDIAQIERTQAGALLRGGEPIIVPGVGGAAR